VNSVGASGAIFGVYGALLAFMIDKRNGVPTTIMQTHAASISIFIVYAVYNGLARTGIDNAAHLGGLAGGLVLGWAFARPPGEDLWATGIFRPIAGAAATAAALTGLLVLTPNTRSAYDAHQHFMADVKWLDGEEKKLIAGARAAAERAANPRSKPADVKREFTAVAQGWSEAHRRLASYRLDPRVSSRDLIDLQMDLQQYAELRGRAMRALAAAADARSADQEQASQDFKRLWKESDAVLQRMNERAKAAAGQNARRR
jgi:rhomboid protease GluP